MFSLPLRKDRPAAMWTVDLQARSQGGHVGAVAVALLGAGDGPLRSEAGKCRAAENRVSVCACAGHPPSQSPVTRRQDTEDRQTQTLSLPSSQDPQGSAGPRGCGEALSKVWKIPQCTRSTVGKGVTKLSATRPGPHAAPQSRPGCPFQGLVAEVPSMLPVPSFHLCTVCPELSGASGMARRAAPLRGDLLFLTSHLALLIFHHSRSSGASRQWHA